MDKTVTFEEIRKNQRNLMMDLDFSQFTELIDIEPKAGSHLIHSMSEPFSEEDIEDYVLRNWMEHFEMHFHQLHASGHMSKDQLIEMIKYIQPRRTIPVHTENQALFKSYFKNVAKIEKGKQYYLK